MVWPERMVLGVLGRRTDEVALVWAVGLASRWGSELHVVAGHHPPIGMFPHIVTTREIRAVRRNAREQLTAGLGDVLRGFDPDAVADVRLTLVTDNQLDDAIARWSRRAGLALFSISPTGLFVQRRRARARRIAARLTCPVSLGPGQAVEPPPELDVVH